MKVEFVRGTLQTKLKSPRNSNGMNSRNPKLRLIWAGVYEIKKPRSMSALAIFKIRKKMILLPIKFDSSVFLYKFDAAIGWTRFLDVRIRNFLLAHEYVENHMQ